MGAAPERHSPTPTNPEPDQSVSKSMGSSETPKISLVTTTQKAPAWGRSIFSLDSGFKGLMLVAGLTVLGIVGLIIAELMQRSALAWQKFGFQFFTGSAWDPVSGEFGALPFIFGTIVSSILALIVAVPLALAVAIFVTEMCPPL